MNSLSLEFEGKKRRVIDDRDRNEALEYLEFISRAVVWLTNETGSIDEVVNRSIYTAACQLSNAVCTIEDRLRDECQSS